MRKVGITVILAVIAAILTIATLVIAEENPRIENFSIIQENGNFKIRFTFKGVAGGLRESEFTIGYLLVRKGVITERGMETGLKLEPVDSPQVIYFLVQQEKQEDGRFKGKVEGIVGSFFEKNRLKSKDKIKFFLFLTDSEGQKSEPVSYEFVFNEDLEI